MNVQPVAAFSSRQVNNKEHELIELIRNGDLFKSQKAWIAGGSVRNFILGREIDSDIDYFFPDVNEHELAKTFFKEKGAEEIRDSEFNTTLKYRVNNKDYEIQLIKFYYNSIDTLLDNFDFTICQFALYGNMVYSGDCSLLDLGGKKLVPHKITFPAASLRRIIKYAKKGFFLCQGSAQRFLEMSALRMQEDTRSVEISSID